MPTINPITRLPLLRPVPILRGLSKAHLFEVARKAAEVTYPPGATVVRQGEPGDTLCIVTKGSLDVSQNGSVVGHLTAGDYFGEISLIDGGPRSATVVAVDNVVLLTLSSADFDSMLEIPYVARTVMMNLAQLLRKAEDV
jgi:CRP-like cAMP-binding protein